MSEDTISYIFGFIAGAIFMLILCLYFFADTRDTRLAQKCAETQGRYDFCVQKVNWEVKK